MFVLFIFIYIFLALINVPFALSKNNPYRNWNWLAIGFQLGVMTAHIVNHF